MQSFSLNQQAKKVSDPGPNDVTVPDLHADCGAVEEYFPEIEIGTDAALILTEALGHQHPMKLPDVYARSDGERLVRFIEKNRKHLTEIMRDDPSRETVTQWTVKMLRATREAKRSTVLTRWFRDRAASADKKGLQALNPLIFNILISVVIVSLAFLFFSIFLKL